MRLDARTSLYGVIGSPLAHTLSPVMHNAAFSETGANAVYLAFETMDAEGAMKAMRSLGVRGLSVTLPHKKAVLPFLDEVDRIGLSTGAVNTVLNEKGVLKGFNTDGPAVVRALEERTPLPGKRCLLIGAGGAAWAAGFSLRDRGVRLIVTNRTEGRGKALASALSVPYVPLNQAGRQDADLVVQATPVGMAPRTGFSPIPAEIFREAMVVMDMVYKPLETRFLREAQARGAIAVSGLSMFVHQGAEQFRLWTGRDAPVDVMRRAALEALRGRFPH